MDKGLNYLALKVQMIFAGDVSGGRARIWHRVRRVVPPISTILIPSKWIFLKFLESPPIN